MSIDDRIKKLPEFGSIKTRGSTNTNGEPARVEYTDLSFLTEGELRSVLNRLLEILGLNVCRTNLTKHGFDALVFHREPDETEL